MINIKMNNDDGKILKYTQQLCNRTKLSTVYEYILWQINTNNAETLPIDKSNEIIVIA